MNLNIATLPLPVYTNASTGAGRRHRIGNLNLDRRAERQFRRVADLIEPASPAPDRDAVASAARQLSVTFPHSHRAPCIQMRLRCLTAMQTMTVDPDWGLEEAQQQPILWITEYATGKHRLLPDRVPVIGGLDDAILVDLAWPSLRLELDDFLSYRRLRAMEAQMRGLHPRRFRFNRDDWLEARAAEIALRQMARQRIGYSYVMPSAPALFRCHG